MNFTQLVVLSFVIFCTVALPVHQLRNKVDGDVLIPGDPGYNESIAIDNAYFQKYPKIVVLPISVKDIKETLKFAKKHKAVVTVKGGGHSAAGYCLNDDIVLDMKHFNQAMMVGPDTAILEAGVRFGEAYNALAPNIPIGGTCKGVGVMGFSMGGGISILSRSYGLMVDNILEFKIVLANGQYLTVDKKKHKDLFWALRGGGGGNFGVVTQIKVRTYLPESERLLSGPLCYPMEMFHDFLNFYNDWVQTIPNKMAAYVAFSLAPPLRGICLLTMYNGDPNEGMQYYQPLFAQGPFLNLVGNYTFHEFIDMFGGGTAVSGRKTYIKAGMIRKGELTQSFLNTLEQYVMSAPSLETVILWDHVGGKMSEIAPDATAFYRRVTEFIFEVKAIWDTPEEEQTNLQWIRNMFNDLEPHFHGSYLNYIDPNQTDWKQAYYGTNYDRLKKVKRKYDPQNFFHFPQSIETGRPGRPGRPERPERPGRPGRPGSNQQAEENVIKLIQKLFR